MQECNILKSAKALTGNIVSELAAEAVAYSNIESAPVAELV